DEARPARALAADVDRELRRIGARDQVRRGEVVEELLAREPAAAAHQLVLHQRDVRGGAAERGEAEPREDEGHFGQASARSRRRSRGQSYGPASVGRPVVHVRRIAKTTGRPSWPCPPTGRAPRYR